METDNEMSDEEKSDAEMSDAEMSNDSSELSEHNDPGPSRKRGRRKERDSSTWKRNVNKKRRAEGMFFFRRHQRGAAPKVLSKPALMAGGTRILGGGIGKTRKYNKAMHQLNGRRDSAITLSTRRSTLTSDTLKKGSLDFKEKRGTHNNRPTKIDDSVWNLVEEHWASLPNTPSHYAAKKASDSILIIPNSLLQRFSRLQGAQALEGRKSVFFLIEAKFVGNKTFDHRFECWDTTEPRAVPTTQFYSVTAAHLKVMRHVVGRRPSPLVCRVPGRVQVSAVEGWSLRTHRLVTLSCQSVLVSTIVRFSSFRKRKKQEEEKVKKLPKIDTFFKKRGFADTSQSQSGDDGVGENECGLGGKISTSEDIVELNVLADNQTSEVHQNVSKSADLNITYTAPSTSATGGSISVQENTDVFGIICNDGGVEKDINNDELKSRILNSEPCRPQGPFPKDIKTNRSLLKDYYFSETKTVRPRLVRPPLSPAGRLSMSHTHLAPARKRAARLY
ncbi:hypothetical protein J6590_100767 [Homalodisca vitripennis]|nr:hypothetical protein J6590_100767 [Homalodisca vitripennis]